MLRAYRQTPVRSFVGATIMMVQSSVTAPREVHLSLQLWYLATESKTLRRFLSGGGPVRSEAMAPLGAGEETTGQRSFRDSKMTSYRLPAAAHTSACFAETFPELSTASIALEP